jgi:hypothetical protein
VAALILAVAITEVDSQVMMVEEDSMVALEVGMIRAAAAAPKGKIDI